MKNLEKNYTVFVEKQKTLHTAMDHMKQQMLTDPLKWTYRKIQKLKFAHVVRVQILHSAMELIRTANILEGGWRMEECWFKLPEVSLLRVSFLLEIPHCRNHNSFYSVQSVFCLIKNNRLRTSKNFISHFHL